MALERAKPSTHGCCKSSPGTAVIGLCVCVDSVDVLVQLGATDDDGGCSDRPLSRMSTDFLASFAMYSWTSRQPQSACWRSCVLSVSLSARSESKHADN